MSVDQFLLSADTTDLNYPEIRPTLDLNFARVKALDPRITFTRSSGGSYVGADGLIKYAGVNEARFDHDPSTGESLGLLVEEARTNLLLRSEKFDTTWINFQSTEISNSNKSPDGTITAYKLIPDSGVPTDQSWIIQDISKLSSPVQYTYSVFLKKGEFNFARLVSNDASSFANRALIEVNISDGSIITNSTTSGTFSNASHIITYFGDEWYRISLTFTSGTENLIRFRIHARDTNISTGDGTSGIYIWGAQLEQGAFPTSYIPTQGSTRTRAADNASITGKNFSGWYRQDEGTVFVSHKALEGLKNRVASSIIYNISTGPTFLSFFYNTNSDRSDIFVFGREYGDLVRFQQNQPTRNKVIFAYDAPSSDYSPYIDGAKITNITTTKLYKPSNYDTLTLAPTPSKLNGTISRLTYFPKRLPNAQLQALTR
jgi:hypothetical protein